MKEIVNSLTIRHQRVFYLVGHSDVNLTSGGWIVVALTGNMVDKAFQSSLYIGRIATVGFFRVSLHLVLTSSSIWFIILNSIELNFEMSAPSNFDRFLVSTAESTIGKKQKSIALFTMVFAKRKVSPARDSTKKRG